MSGSNPTKTAAVEISAPRIAPKVIIGISVPPVMPLLVESKRRRARSMSRAIRRYHTGACERKIASIRACPEPSVPLRKKPIVAVSPKIVSIFTQSGIFLSFLFIRELNALYRFVNTMEIPPTATPIIIASQKKLTGSAVGAGISKSR